MWSAPGHEYPFGPIVTYLSLEILLKSDLLAGFVCMRRLAVSTNWPTVALKPARKALNGCHGHIWVSGFSQASKKRPQPFLSQKFELLHSEKGEMKPT